MQIPHRLLIQAQLPHALEGLQRLATNFYWTWHPAAAEALRQIDPDRARQGVHPLQILLQSPNLEKLSKDQAFIDQVHQAVTQLDDYLTKDWVAQGNLTPESPAAYFCAEYGLHESFAQYSGGLGILAGDHCKEASDMRLPFVAVGCFYHLGFFRQVLDPGGRQEHLYPRIDQSLSPVQQVLKPSTQEDLTVTIPSPGREVHAAVLIAHVGRVPLLLLDTNIESNQVGDREITAQLYTRGREMRFQQELVLGVGGAMALQALGIKPSVFHMNEGHSALLLIQRLSNLLKQGVTLAEARKMVKETSILTIHTPVTAGNERFDVRLAKRVLAPLLTESGIPIDVVLKLAFGDDGDRKVFDMTAFALRHSRDANGVSLLHGVTADKTWRKAVNLSVRGLTNGVHMPTWLGPEIVALATKNGASFEGSTDFKLTESGGRRKDWAAEPSLQEIWASHIAQKRRLIAFANERAVARHARYGESPSELQTHASDLDPKAFLIGFARRFASYKRASLLFRDPKRLAKLLNDPERPVQVVFAGKAHPADGDGQALIAEVYRFTQDPRFKGKVFLIEDYDMEVGRMLVQGVDLWLNNPRRPLEASGTSGMKAAANGIPSCSVLDGWWDEAFEDGARRNGFAIGGRKAFRSVAAQDKSDGAELYRVLQDEVTPLFFERDETGFPAKWVQVMKQSMVSSIHAFSTRRMLEDYIKLMY